MTLSGDIPHPTQPDVQTRGEIDLGDLVGNYLNFPTVQS